MPPFLFYCSIILFVAASALFGVNLMTSPVFVSHDQPQAASMPPSKAEPAAAARDDDKAKSDKLLSPVYPTTPGAAKTDVRTVYPPSNPELAASAEQKAPAETTGTAAADNAPVGAPAPAKTEHADLGASAPQLNASQFRPVKADSAQPPKPAIQQTANKCDVQACAAAYKSFSAADCTYQPFEGPRRVCTGAPAAAPKQEAKQERPEKQARKEATDKDAELREVVRAVRALRDGNDSARVEDDSSARDGDVYLGGGHRVIVLPDDDF